jgi:hypothetical protein
MSYLLMTDQQIRRITSTNNPAILQDGFAAGMMHGCGTWKGSVLHFAAFLFSSVIILSGC